MYLLQVVSQSTISQGVADGIRYSLAAAGIVVGIPFARAAILLSKEWGAFGEVLRSTAASVKTLSDGLEAEGAHRQDIVTRLDRTEFILIGDQGANGVRGDVRRLVTQVNSIEQRIAPVPRRKSTGRRRADQ